MPVHAHDTSESLEPERVGEAGEKRLCAVVMDDVFRDGGAEQRHTVGQPIGDGSAVEREIGGAGTLHESILNGLWASGFGLLG